MLYRLPPSGFVQGQVTDANDDLPLAGATVKAIRGGSVFRETTTDSNGNYRMQLPLDTYDDRGVRRELRDPIRRGRA